MATNTMMSRTLGALIPGAPPAPPKFIDFGISTMRNPAYGAWLKQWTDPGSADPVTTPIPPYSPPATPTDPVAPVAPAPPSTPSVPSVPGGPTPPTGAITPPPLPGIPSLPSIYTGKLPDYYTPQINQLITQLDQLKAMQANPNSQGYDPGATQGQIDILTGQLNDLQAAKLTAQQGVAANTTEQSQLSMLPGLESFLSQNLTAQSQYAMSQLNPLIEQRLNALGILDSGALPAVEARTMTDLLASQQSRIGDFLTGSMSAATSGLSNSQYENTINALLGATQRNFAGQDLSDARSFALQQQKLAIQAQKDAEMPLWQQLLLNTIGGLSKGAGSALAISALG